MSATPSPAAETPSPPRGWWRRNAWWLLGALVLGTLAFLLPYRDALYEQARRSPQSPIEVRQGEWADYAGARWRVVDVRRVEKIKLAKGDYFHPDAALVAVRFELVPVTGVSPDKLDICKGRLSDAQGRRWDANALPLSQQREYREDLGTGCGSRLGTGFQRVQARRGQPFRFVHLYQVPTTLPTRGLHAEILMPAHTVEPQGSYLRFAL
ncbi:hypothetical protein [Luteimonas aquatica]|uniref:hypothetical protein n=1 Tax=Luteimonas aquatica TaxID=450364 RepID=UPI001F58845E|nr:hypothetical protein [Luteimonas aquatica]